MGVNRACLGFKTGVGDFRREAGTWNVVEEVIPDVQPVVSITFELDMDTGQ